MQLIKQQSELEALCDRMATAPFIAVDTEFMREENLLANIVPDPGR